MSRLLSVRRVLSETPLAKLHDRWLQGGAARARKTIPWEAFDRARYPEPALALASDQAKKLAEGEYGAVGLFGQIASGLALTQAPFDIISAASSIAADEIRHADYCSRFAELCSARPHDLEVDASAVLEACRNLDQVEEVDYFLLKYSAIGETLAGALLTECRRGASDPVARAMYTALASDEIHHARLGWYYFAWRAPRWTREEQQRLADRIAPFVLGLESEFWTGRDAPRSAQPAAAALGVLDSDRQRGVIADVMIDEIVPGLDALGLSGSVLWDARHRGGATQRSAACLVLPGLPQKFDADATDSGFDWLERAVNADGAPRFHLDPCTGQVTQTGMMYAGRAAIVLAALQLRPAGLGGADRLRRWLEAEIAGALGGNEEKRLESEPAQVAATLALATLAGCDLRQPLLERAQRVSAFADRAWYAAQVALALGTDTPCDLWRICVDDLERAHWAPWTARAAARIGDVETHSRAVRYLLGILTPLDEGGACSVLPAPPIAQVAATVEALAGVDSAEAEARVRAGRAYLRRWQFRPPFPPGVEAEWALGAWPLSPAHWGLRMDVTAHALLALHT